MLIETVKKQESGFRADLKVEIHREADKFILNYYANGGSLVESREFPNISTIDARRIAEHWIDGYNLLSEGRA